jgi:hypothetical protein
MKRMLAVVTVTAMVLAGCSMFKTKMAPEPVAMAKPLPAGLVDANGAPIQAIPFVTGVSSVTVENMAKAQSCRGGQGAGLVTPAGPVEVYRMRCDNGRVFMARCELRQCKQM